MIKKVHRNVILAGILLAAVCSGLIFGLSIFVKPLCDLHGWDTDQSAIICSFMFVFSSIGNTLANFLVKKIGIRGVAICGSAMYGVGLMVSAFVSDPYLMFIFWSVIAGTGCGLLYIDTVLLVAAWFPDKRGSVTGLLLCFWGLSPTVCSPILFAAIDTIGVAQTILLMGIVFGVVTMTVSVLLIRDPDAAERKNILAHKENAAVSSDGEKNRVYYTVREAIRTKAFWLYFAGMFFFNHILFLYEFVRICIHDRLPAVSCISSGAGRVADGHWIISRAPYRWCFNR